MGIAWGRAVCAGRTCRRKGLLALLALGAGSVFAQPAPPASAPAEARPRIGLVLSGGGARGGAHLGVLKVLRELRVPVDVVVGTSAGSIVGAAYASGMRIEDIEGELGGQSTAALFHDITRADLPARLKADEAINFIGPEVGISARGLALPKGAVAGVSLEAVLRRMTSRQRGTHFDELPLPFRAVATDLASAEMVVLDRGSLATAVRASMALPALVNPVEVDGRLLIDGGVTRNLPVDLARQLGAQVVIAVNIGTPLRRRDQLTSLLSVSDQLVRILTARNVAESLSQLGPRDVLITPELGSLGAADFDRLAEAAADGEKAARAAAADLARYSVDDAAYAEFEVRRLRSVPAGGVLDAVQVAGTQRVNPAVVLAAIRSRPGEPFDAERADADMKRLYAGGDFERVSYRLDESAGGGRVLTVEVTEKAWGPDYLRLGLGLSSDFQGNSTFDVRLVHRRTWLNALGAEWRNDFQFGRTDMLRTEWHQPLDASQISFAAAHARVRREPFDIFVDGNRFARYRLHEALLGLDLGAELRGTGELRAGLVRGRVRLATDTGVIPGPLLIPSTNVGGLELRLRVDRMDSLRFPREGVALDMRYFRSEPGLGAETRYGKLDLAAQGALSMGAHSLRLGLFAQRGVGGGDLPGWELSQLGGFLRLSGYRTGELLGTDARLGRIVYTHRVATPGLLDGVYAGVSAEAGRLADAVGTTGNGALRGNALFLAADSPLGPIYFGLGFARGGQRAAYLYLGLP